MLGENIKALRKKKGYSQETLAQQLFVVRQTVSKWEKGLSVPDADMLEKLAEALDVSVNELLDKEIREEDKTDKADEIAIQLAILNEQLANQMRRRKKILKIVLIIIIALFILPLILLLPFRSMVSSSGTTVVEEEETANITEMIEYTELDPIS